MTQLSTNLGKATPFVFGAFVFLIAVLLTEADFGADSADYVGSVIAYQRGTSTDFIEFAHLWWRPLGWALWNFLYPDSSEAVWRLEIMTVYWFLCHLCGLIATLTLIRILLTLKVQTWVLAVVTVSFVFSNAVLNYSQTGTSYVPALMFYMVGLYFILRDPESLSGAVLSGIFLALSIFFWVAFLYTVPAVLVASLILRGFERRMLVRSAAASAAFCVMAGLFYGLAILALDAGSVQDVRAWVVRSSNGNEIQGLTRTVFGIARSFVHMGNDGVLFKRFLLGDEYNAVGIGTLVSASLWKLGLFYAVAAGMLLLLWQKPESRKLLVLFLAAAVPMIGFSMFFDGAARERYLPLFPLAFVTLAVSLTSEKFKALGMAMGVSVVILAMANANALSVWTVSKQQSAGAARLELLSGSARDGDLVILVNWTDSLVNFDRTFPFHPSNSTGRFRVLAATTPGTAQTRLWREEFALRSLHAWDQGNSVWLSTRAFASAPKADWNWTEGDDKNVKWSEFPDFFGRLETGEKLGDENGFVRILPSAANKESLSAWAKKFDLPIVL